MTARSGANAVAFGPDQTSRDWRHRPVHVPDTIRRHTFALLSSVMRTAASGRRRLITANPCQVERPFVVARKFEPDPATPDEVAIIVGEMPDKYRALILLAAWCGSAGARSANCAVRTST